MRPTFALAFLIIACACAMLWWHRTDTLPPHQDEARHLRASLHYLRDLDRPFSERVALIFFRRYESYPPLMYIATIPFYLAGGTGRSSAGMVNALFVALMLWSAFAIGRSLYSEKAGLLAALLLACYPVIVGLSRLYVLEIPETALVSLAVYAAMRAAWPRRFSRYLFLGAVLGLGMLVKWHFLIFAAPPVLYFLAAPAPALPRIPLRRKIMPLACAAAVAAAVAAPWYMTHFAAITDFVGRNIVRDFRGAPPPIFSAHSLLFYPYAFLDTLLLVPMTVLLCIGAAAAVRRRKAHPALLLWLAGPIIALALTPQKSPRFLAPVLPAAALLTAGGLCLLPRNRLRGVLIGGACAMSAANFMLLTFPLPWGNADISFPLPFLDPAFSSWFTPRGELLRTELPSYSMGPPRRERWPNDMILSDLTSLSGASPEKKVALGWFIYPDLRFNRYNLLYAMELGGYPIKWVPPERARFILTRLVTDDQRRQLDEWARPSLILEEIRSYRLPDGSNAVLYRTWPSRRRHYAAHELPRDTGVEKERDQGAADGWARFADRDASEPGAAAKVPPQPMAEGSYRLRVRFRFDRPRGEGAIARVRVSTGGGGRILALRDIRARDAGPPGEYRTASLDFTVPERNRIGIEVLHTGAADLRIDCLDIGPCGTAGADEAVTQR